MEAVHRLRDLDPKGRVVAAVVGALLLVPVGTSVGRALAVDWRPSNDDALIVLRAHDVFSDDPPLVGQPSTADEHLEGSRARHPGPIEFYLLALPTRALGQIAGTLLTAAAISGGSVLLAAWVAFRRSGPMVGVGAAVLLGLTMWSSGTAVLSDPISSNVGGYPLIAGCALAWSTWRGDRRLWPLAAAVWSFTIQQHLAILGVAGLVAAWGIAGAVTTTVTCSGQPDRHRARTWCALAAVVTVICWAPPLYDQLVETGNLARIVDYSASDERATLGTPAGLRAVGRAVALPPLLLRRELAVDHMGGADLVEPLGADTVGVLLGLVVAVGTTVATLRRRTGDHCSTSRTDRLVVLATGAVVAAGGVVTAANVPQTFEASRINFYRWVWPVSIAVWGVAAWTVGDLLARRRSPAWIARVAAGASIVTLTLVVTAASLVVQGGDQRRDQQVFAFEAETEAAVQAAVPDRLPVRLVMIGRSAFVAQGPALAAALVEDGYEVRVDPPLAAGFGDLRATRRRGDPEAIVQLLSDQGPPPPGEGRCVARATLPTEPGGVDNSWTDDTFEVWVDLP